MKKLPTAWIRFSTIALTTFAILGTCPAIAQSVTAAVSTSTKEGVKGNEGDSETAKFDIAKVGQEAPDFSISTLDGRKVRLSGLKGKVVLINFFATWCGPCMQEFPHLEKEIWQEFKGAQFEVLAISREETEPVVGAFQKKNKWTLPIACDTDRKVFSKYAAQYIPRNYLIDGQGKIIFASTGYEEKEFKRLIDLIRQHTQPKPAVLK